MLSVCLLARPPKANKENQFGERKRSGFEALEKTPFMCLCKIGWRATVMAS
jgi:hypothetical protein